MSVPRPRRDPLQAGDHDAGGGGFCRGRILSVSRGRLAGTWKEGFVEAQEITDSPAGRVAGHVQKYVETDGVSGHRYQGKDALLLVTRGRRTGTLRTETAG